MAFNLETVVVDNANLQITTDTGGNDDNTQQSNPGKTRVRGETREKPGFGLCVTWVFGCKPGFWLWDFFGVFRLIEGGFGLISVKHALNPDFSGPSAALKIWWKTRVLCNSRVSSPEPRFPGPKKRPATTDSH